MDTQMGKKMEHENESGMGNFGTHRVEESGLRV